jgi:putative transposase
MGHAGRSGLPDGFFHVVCRGVFGRRIYLDDVDRTKFVARLWRCANAYDWICQTFCLMSTHYHLVVESTAENLARGLQQVNGRHALSFNARHRRYGHLFAGRYTVRVIEEEEYLYEACSYVLLNPVKAGLCDRAEDWPWSYSRFDADVGARARALSATAT